MFRSWEEHRLGTPLYFLQQSMTDVLRSLNKQEVTANNHTTEHYICTYEVDRLLGHLNKSAMKLEDKIK